MKIVKRIVFFVVLYFIFEEIGFAADVEHVTSQIGAKITATVKSGLTYVLPIAGVFGGIYTGIKFMNGEQDAGKHLMMFAVGYAVLWGVSQLI